MSTKKISWVMASRNDGYGGNSMQRLRITLSSIFSLPDSEVILVEFCRRPQDGSLMDEVKDFMGDRLRIIAVDCALLDLLHADSTKNMGFYEHLAKDIGIRRANGELIIACNPDNIFPLVNFDEAVSDMEKGLIVRAMRNEIARDNVNKPISDLLSSGESGDFQVIQRFSTAAGDFTGMKKSIYKEIGGYALVHGSWHLDNLLLSQAQMNGYEVSAPYSHFHINHEQSVTDSKTLSDKKSAGFDTDWVNFKPISKNILNRIGEFIKE